MSILVILACALVLALVGTAAAANPTQSAYEPTTCTACSTHSDGTLPFTGVDVGALAAVGVTLAAGGLLIRRRVGTQID
jgi:hypothetical protein